MEAAPNFEVKKTRKLVGELAAQDARLGQTLRRAAFRSTPSYLLRPYKIFRNTAFVKNMFSSDLEVGKDLGYIGCRVLGMVERSRDSGF